MKILEIETSFGQKAFEKIVDRHTTVKEYGWDYCVCVDDSFFQEKLSKAGIRAFVFKDFLPGKETYFSEIITETAHNDSVSKDVILPLQFYYNEYFSSNHKTKEKYRKWVYLSEKLAHRIIDMLNPDFILQTQGAEIIRIAFEEAARKKSIPAYYEGFSPYYGNKSFYPERYADSWLTKEPDESDIEKAETWLNEITTQSICWSKYISREKNRERRFRNIKRYLKKRDSVFAKNSFYEIAKNHFLKRWESFKRRSWYVLKRKNLSVPAQPFLFFPLHLPYESQVTLRSNNLIIQSALIALISTMLPEKFSLVIKEHPDNIGRLAKWELAYVRKFPNVYLVPPDIHPHKVIKKSCGIITINSTAGFEGIIFDKPVFVLGRVFYANQGVTIDIDNIKDIPVHLDTLEGYKLDRPLKINLLAKVIANSYTNVCEFIKINKTDIF